MINQRSPWIWALLIPFLLTFIFYFLSHRGQPMMIAAYLTALVLIIGCLLRGLAIRQLFTDNRLLILLAGLLFSYLVGSHYVREPGPEAHKLLGKAISLYGFVLAAGLLARQQDAERLLFGVILATATLAACLSIQLDLALPDYQPLDEDRLYAIGIMLANPVVSGISFSWVLLLTITIVLSRGWSPWVLLVTLPLAFASYRAQSLGASLALIGGFAALAATLLPRSLRAWVFGSGLILFTVAAGLLLTGHIEVNGSHSWLPRGDSFRQEIWQHAIDRANDASWLFGLGPQVSGEQLISHRFLHPHSLFVATYFYGGMISLVLLLMMLCVAWWQVLSAPDQPQRLLAPLLTFACIALVFDGDRLISNMSIIWLTWWLPLGLLMASRSQSWPASSR